MDEIGNTERNIGDYLSSEVLEERIEPTLTWRKKRKRTTQFFEKYDNSKRRHDKNMERTLSIMKRDQRHILKNQRLILHNQKLILDKVNNCKRHQIYANNKTPSLSNPYLLKPALPGSSVDECLHGEVLQENMKMLVRDMDLSDGLILDEMLQNGSLTDNESQEIRELSRPDKSRKLATVLGRSNKTKFKEFLRMIAKEEFYPHIANSLETSYKNKLIGKEKHITCVKCFIIEKVNIKHILDHLCENRVIDLCDIDHFIARDNTDISQLWCKIFQQITHPLLGETYVSIFKESMQEHYPHIAKKILYQNDLKCVCTSTVMSYPSGSEGRVSELSTTTPIIPEVNTHDRQHTSDRIRYPLDISTPTVIPQLKKDTSEWVQTQHMSKESRESDVERESCCSFKKIIYVKKNRYSSPKSPANSRLQAQTQESSSPCSVEIISILDKTPI